MNQYPNAAQGLKMMFWAEIVSCIAVVLAVILNLLAVIVTVVSGILILVGLYKAGTDHDGYRTAFILSIVNLVLSFLSGADGFFGGLISIISAVVSFAVVYYVCTTTAGLLESCGRPEAAQKGGLWKIYLVCTVVNVVCVIVSWIPVLNVLAAVVTVVSGVVLLVAMILYLIFLYNSYQALGA